MMRESVKYKLKVYALSIALCLAVGGLGALAGMRGMRVYSELIQPELAPPGWVFPAVWTLLYTLMGLSAAMIYLSKDDCRRDALRVFLLQLFLNLGWTVLFFALSLRLAAFVWIVVLEAVIVVMVAMFFAIRPLAAYLQIPYFFWVAFAAYLNFAFWWLNR